MYTAKKSQWLNPYLWIFGLGVILGLLFGYAVFSSSEPEVNLIDVTSYDSPINPIVREAVRDEIREQAGTMTAEEFITREEPIVISTDNINARLDTMYDGDSPVNVLDMVVKSTQAFKYILKDADKTLSEYLKEKKGDE